MHYLYKITDALNNKVYIGQSNKEIERWRQHKYYSRLENPVQYISRAIKKYGVKNFIYEVIAMCQLQEDANWTETELIKQYDSQNKDKGYNIAPGGDHVWNAGLPAVEQPMYGKHHTEESKAQISKSNMGKIMPPHTEEWKNNMSEIMTGRILTKEWKDKIGKSRTGIKHTEKSKKQMSISAKDKIITPETRVKMSESHLGKPKSAETKSRISVSRKGIFIGEKHSRAKLTWVIVNEIRGAYKNNPNLSKKELSKKYGVTVSTIHNIIANRIWIV